MSNILAEAMIRLYNRGHTEHDYFVVGGTIYCSHPDSSSELDIENADVNEECLRILKEKGAPFFDSWESFETGNGTAVVRSWRNDVRFK